MGSYETDHPIFGNGAVVGVSVCSVLNMASLASTGDWSRFGKNTGLSMVGGLGGGFAGRWGAGKLTGLGEITGAEVEKLYETIMENYAMIGVYPDSFLSKRDVVTGMLDQSTSSKSVLVRMAGAVAADITNLEKSLFDWQQGSPEGLEVFLQGLRDAATSQ
ncbi:hypothetical protein FOC1_g10001618 [Fusarium oxysporum f. sp. cubense race 1]|uniref:Uncharacterized protein n=1 Tax=Fusarium oxysporum f. sp. cubense (strain race 1) TaxID=1229664 RepID=N4V3L7_FUSC1|nr:hypothetical protein FOC1_g10001618 [Fusarium oxysporum f. sp. cubense race 1]